MKLRSFRAQTIIYLQEGGLTKGRLSMKELDILLALREGGYITAGQLAAQVQVSEKTVRNIIQSLRTEIEGYGAHIGSKPKRGYELKIIDEEKFLSFVRKLQDQKKAGLQSTEERVLFILRVFLEHSDEYVKVDDLAEMMHVSRSCVNRDIREVKKILEAGRLKLEARPHYGLRIIGEEHALRACIVRYWVQGSSGSDEAIRFNHVMFQKLMDCTKAVLAGWDFQINELQLQNLVVHLFVAVIRVENGNFIAAKSSLYEELVGLKEYEIAQELRISIGEALGLTIPEQEAYYITIHLAARKNMAGISSEHNSIVISEQVQQVVDRIIDHVDQIYSLDLKEDIDLVMALSLHFVTLDLRLRYALRTVNPIMENIKQRYQIAFLIAQSCNEVIREFYPQPLDEDELSYIALYFELAMERQRKGGEKKNILIICSTGSGTSRLLKYEYEKKFRHHVQNIYTADPSQLPDFDLDKVDYIFSTIKIDVPVSKPVILIDPIPGRHDIENVTHLISEKSEIRSFFRKELFFDHIHGETPEDVIKEITEKIAKVEPIPEDFQKLVLEREKLGVTSFTTGVAFPHPSRPCTEHTFVAVGLLDKKVLWRSDRVRMVYLFSLAKGRNKDEHLPGLYRLTGELLSDEGRIRDIVEKRSYENFIDHLLEIEMAGE